jgi:hypothetical protein
MSSPNTTTENEKTPLQAQTSQENDISVQFNESIFEVRRN